MSMPLWLEIGNQTPIIRELEHIEYSQRKLREAIPSLKERSCTSDDALINDLQEILLKCGVILLIVEPPANFPLHGVTHWYKRRVPIIQRTLRQKTDGYFIWTLFHEIGHILNNERGLQLDGEGTGHLGQQEKINERKANDFVRELLFGPNGIESFYDEECTLESVVDRTRQAGTPIGPVIREIHRMRIEDYRWGRDRLTTIDASRQAKWAQYQAAE